MYGTSIIGCSIAKFYTVCKIIAVFSFSIITTVSKTAWTAILRLPGVRSMDQYGYLSYPSYGSHDQETKNENNRLKKKVEELERELEQKRHQLTEMFGKVIERKAKDNFHNAGDAVQPIDISKCCGNIFDEEWRDVMVNLFKDDEEYGISFLSKILQDCQTFCKATADKQLAIFTNPCSSSNGRDIKEILESEEDVHNIYKIRRKIGQHRSNKDALIECFNNEVKKSEAVQKLLAKLKSDQTGNGELTSEHESEDGENDHASGGNENIESESCTGMSEPFERLEEYIKKCTDMCWEAVISDPPLFFKFDVVGHHFDDIKSQYCEYISKISTGVGEHDTVKTVVWPAVVKTCSDGREVFNKYGKGYVLLYDNKNQ